MTYSKCVTYNEDYQDTCSMKKSKKSSTSLQNYMAILDTFSNTFNV